MDKTCSEKILSRAMGKPVKAGDIIFPEPDLITIHDWYVVNFDMALTDFGINQLFAPQKVLISTDHEPIAVSLQAADRQKKVREIVAKYGIKHFYDAGRGGHGHIFPMELGYIKPGMLVIGYDVHVNNFGALACLAIPIVTEISELLACGSVWIRVPETIRVNLSGILKPGITYRDVADRMIADIGAEIADYSVFEFGGPALENINIEGRITLCNRPIEIGVKSTIFETDNVTREYLQNRIDGTCEELQSDLDASYKLVIEQDLSIAEPQVSVPPTPDNVVNVSDVAGKVIDYAFIGSCANCTLSDLREAARILKGQTVKSGVRLIITPGTQEVVKAASEEGLIEIFIKSGSLVTSPGCGPCAAGRIGPLADGEVSINTGTRNDFGRLGSNDAEIYLGSPLTVAASAVTGRITDPREFM